MITLRDWRRTQLADGVALIPPGGALLGGIRIRELQRPLLPAAVIFAREASRVPTRQLEVGSIERMHTGDGEYAAFQVQRGVSGTDDAAFVRYLGVVYGDDACTVIVGSTTIADSFAMFERVTRTCVFQAALGLGHRRQRRFLYTPPADWSGIPRGLDTAWIPPRYPDDDAMLTVYAAEPAVSTPSELRDAVLARMRFTGWSQQALSPAARVFTDGELSGVAWRATGVIAAVASVVKVVVLEDERFLYPFELVCSPAQDEVSAPVLDAVVRSARPIPLPEAQPRVDAMLLWAL